MESNSPVPSGPARGSDFAVLPGESLAKYARANIQPLDEAEEEEIRGLQESDSAAEPDVAAEPEAETSPVSAAAGAESESLVASEPDPKQR